MCVYLVYCFLWADSSEKRAAVVAAAAGKNQVLFGKVSQEYKKMSAGTKRSNADEDNADEAAVDGGPGLAYMPFVVMEDLLDKLKLLNYEEVRIYIYNAEATTTYTGPLGNYQKIQDWVLLDEFRITTTTTTKE